MTEAARPRADVAPSSSRPTSTRSTRCGLSQQRLRLVRRPDDAGADPPDRRAPNVQPVPHRVRRLRSPIEPRTCSSSEHSADARAMRRRAADREATRATLKRSTCESPPPCALERWAVAKFREGARRSRARSRSMVSANSGCSRTSRWASRARPRSRRVRRSRSTGTTSRLGAHRPCSGPCTTAWRTVRTHLDLTSVRFHDALRAGVALGLAVWVPGRRLRRARLLGRARRARRAAHERARRSADSGASDHRHDRRLRRGFPAPLARRLVEGRAMAAPPPARVPFGVRERCPPVRCRQAAFTTFVRPRVNILEPKGWHTGPSGRDVLAGTAVALITGIVFWPRGAHVQVRQSLAALYRASATLLAQSLGLALTGCGGRRDGRAC